MVSGNSPYVVTFDQFPNQLSSGFCMFLEPPASPLGPQCRIALPPPGPPAVRVRECARCPKFQGTQTGCKNKLFNERFGFLYIKF